MWGSSICAWKLYIILYYSNPVCSNSYNRLREGGIFRRGGGVEKEEGRGIFPTILGHINVYQVGAYFTRVVLLHTVGLGDGGGRRGGDGDDVNFKLKTIYYTTNELDLPHGGWLES